MQPAARGAGTNDGITFNAQVMDEDRQGALFGVRRLAAALKSGRKLPHSIAGAIWWGRLAEASAAVSARPPYRVRARADSCPTHSLSF